MTIEQQEAKKKAVLTRRDRVLYWWRRRPPPIRKLIVGGVISSLVLLVVALWFDAFGGAWARRHPFLADLPGDLFRLAALGTVGVLWIDGLKAWSRSWATIVAVIPVLDDSVETFLTKLCDQVGVEKPSAGNGLLGAYNLCERIGDYFDELVALPSEGTHSLEAIDAAIDIPAEDVRRAWATAPKTERHRDGPGPFEEAAARLYEVLSGGEPRPTMTLAALPNRRKRRGPDLGAWSPRCHLARDQVGDQGHRGR
jgi:hypothetical protein